MAKKLGFTYTLSVDEKQSTANLKQSIKNIQQKNNNLSIPVNLKLNTSIPREMITSANEALKKKNLSLSVGLKINAKSITNSTISEAQKILNEKNKQLTMNVGLRIDEKALKKIETINSSFKEIKDITSDIVNNVQKLAGVKLQIFEGVDGSGKSSSSKGKASNTSDLQKEIDYQQTSLQILMEKLKTQKEYNSIINDEIGSNRLNMLQERINALGTEARTTAEVKQEARELKQEYDSIKNAGKITLWEDEQIAKGKQYYENLEKTSKALSEEIKKQKESLETRYRAMSQTSQIKALVGEEKKAWEQVGIAIKSLDGKNIAEVRQEARLLSQQMSNLKTDGIVRLNSAWANLRKTLISLPATYLSIFTVANSLNSLIRESISYTKELDEAYTDVAVSMDVSREQFDAWTKTARGIAQANGQMTTSAMDMVKIYATAGESIEQIQDKLQGTLMIQNITQWDAETTTSAVNSIVSQYKLLETEINGITGDISNAIQYMGDTLVGISNELTIDNVKGIQEMVSAIDDAGSVVRTAGGSMEWYMAVTGALSESMNANGAEVGAAMRMISARTLQQKQAFEELNDTGEDTEIAMANAEKALKQIGVSIRNGSNGDLRTLEEILGDVAEKWRYLDDSTKQFVGEKLAGNNRRSYFESLMENYERVLTLQKAGENSIGELAEANAIRVESLASKMNIFQDKLMSLLDGMTPLLKTTIDFGSAMLDLIDKVGVMNTAVAGLSMSFFNFNTSGKAMRDTLLSMIGTKSDFIARTLEEKESILTSIETTKINIATLQKEIAQKKLQNISIDSTVAKLKTEQATLKSTQIQLVATTLKTAALQAVMSAGLSIAITGVTALLTGFVSELKKTTKGIEDVQALADSMSQSFSQVREGLSGADNGKTLIDEYKELQEILSTATGDELVESQEKLAEVQAKLIELFPQASEKIDEQGNLVFANIEKYEQLTKAEKEYYEQQLSYLKLEAEANYAVVEDSIKKKEEAIKEAQANYESYMKSRSSYNEGDSWYLKWGEYAAEEARTIQQLRQEINELQGTLSQYDQAMSYTGEKVEDTSDKMNNLSNSTDNAEQKVLSLLNTFEKLSSGGVSYSNALDNVNKALKECGNNVENQGKVVDQFLEQFPQYASSVENVNDVLTILGERAIIEFGKAQAEAESFLKTLQESETYTYDMAEKLLEAYPELATHIEDVAYVQDFLNGKISDMQDIQNSTYAQMMSQDEEFWNNKIKNTEAWFDFYKQAEESMVNIGAESLGIQYDDFVTYINEKGGLREIDVQNAKNLADAQNIMEAGLLTQLVGYYGQYVNQKNGFREDDSHNIADFLNWQGVAEVQTIDELKKLWAEYYNAKKQEIQKSISTIEGAIGNYGDLGNVTSEDMARYSQLRKQLADLNKINDALSGGSLFDKIDTTFKGISASLGSTIGSSIGGNKLSTGTNSSSSSTKKEVADLDLVIDRYYKLTDAIDDLNNKLAYNRALQNNAKDYNTRKKLMEEEIKLIEQQITAYENLALEQRNDLLDNKNILSTYGFTFDGEGNIENYASQLKKLQDNANKLSGDAKSAAIEEVKWIAEAIESYTKLSNSSIPDTVVTIEELRYEIEQLNKEHQKQLEKIEKLGNRYFDLEQAIKKVDNALSLNQAKQENATASERVALMEEEIALIKEKQKLVAEQKTETQKEANELKDKLASQGVTFNEDGTISNYQQVINNLKTSANLLAGEYRDNAVEEIEELIEKMEEYSDLVSGTIPELEVEWEEYTNSLKEAEKAKAELVASIEKDITSAITNEYKKRTEALKSELQKQKDAYNKQFDEEDWEDSLSEEQRKLDEIQQQINNLSRDTSLAGKLKLEQLLQEYKDQQKVIDDMIRDHEKELGNERFDEEMEKLDEELEEALSAENLSAMVNQALVDGFVTIGDEVIELNSLMTSWLDETGDGLTALGNSLKEELINNLEVAKQLMAEMGIVNTSVGNARVGSIDSASTIGEISVNDVVSRLNDFMGATQTSSSVFQIESLMRIDGNVDKDVLPEVQKMIENAKEELIDNLAAEILKR